MTDTNFQAILDKLKQMHEQYPDVRFGEMVQWAVDRGKRGTNVNLFNITSKELLEHIDALQRELNERRKR